jgi:hypothetical protein
VRSDPYLADHRYGGIRSKHPTLAARAAVEAARRVSAYQQEPDAEDFESQDRLGLAQKFLLANEENTFNINDLWVSAAVAQDTAVFDEEEDDENAIEATPRTSLAPTPSSELGSPSVPGSLAHSRGARGRVASAALYKSLPGHRLSVSQGGRRFSTTSGQLPAIFADTGLVEPAGLVTDVQSPAPTNKDPFFPSPQADRRAGGLSAIAERPASSEATHLVETAEKLPTWGALPILMITQYGLLALHNTTHDQLFLSFLVT